MLARKSVYWRGISADIHRVVSECQECLLRRKAPSKEPLIPHEVPEKPWYKVACDIFAYGGYKYQLITDYFSKYIEVEVFPSNPKAKEVIAHLKSVFSRFGYPKC